LIKANASMDSIAEKEIMQDAEAFADELVENDENKPQKVNAYKKKKVEEHHRWKEKAYHGMPATRSDKFKEEHSHDVNRPRFLSNHTHYSTTDKDARIAVKPGKPRQFNYLAQTSVDTQHHVITHIQAYHADKKDSQCLPAVIKGLKENLEPEGIIIEQILADTGYSSGAALKALEQNNITGYIPNFGQYKHEREGFTYHKKGDYYQCTQNKKLVFKKSKVNNGYAMREYRSSRKDCANCPLRSTCIGKSFEKSIRETADKPYYDKMHERLKTSYARKMKKLRQSTVEPVLGTLINFLAMKRVNTRGIKLANKCMMIAAIAYNLKKMMKFKNNRPMAAIAQIPKDADLFLLSLFFLSNFFFHHRKVKFQTVDQVINRVIHKMN